MKKIEEEIKYDQNLAHLPNSSEGTNFEAIDLIAINEVPFNISAMGPVQKGVLYINTFIIKIIIFKMFKLCNYTL